jgi:prepilin peptidase CpaA
MEFILLSVLVMVVAVAVWTDVRKRRIPNALTATALILALGLRAALGSGALLDGFLGAGLALVVLLPLFAMGGVGGGDAKLLIAVGAFLGPQQLFVALLATAVAGGVIAVAYAIRRGVVLPLILNTGGLVKYVVTLGHGGERTTRTSAGAVNIPYAVAIAAGTLFSIWYGAGI